MSIKMKRNTINRRFLFAAVLASFTVFATLPGLVLADTTKLRVANWLPPVHHMTTTLRAWADELEAASEGELEVEIMSAPLAKPNGQYDLAKNDVVDIAYSVAAYHPKRFWKLMAVETPFAAPSAEKAGVAAWQWYEKHGFMAEDTSDTKLLALFAHAPHLYHSTKPLTTLAEFKDKKIRVGGNGVKIAEMIGAVPVSMPPGQTNEAMSKGTIDVSQFPWESVKGFNQKPGRIYLTARKRRSLKYLANGAHDLFLKSGIVLSNQELMLRLLPAIPLPLCLKRMLHNLKS